MPSQILCRENDVYAGVISGELDIDEDGRIWRLAARRGDKLNGGTKLIPCERRRAEHRLPLGYLQVRAMYDGKRFHALAHRIVYRHFHGILPDSMTVNHKNGIKDDNRPSNLELVTDSGQMQHMIKTLKKGRVLNQWGEANHAAKLTDIQVAEIRRRRISGQSLRAIAKDYEIAVQTVSKIALGLRRSKTL